MEKSKFGFEIVFKGSDIKEDIEKNTSIIFKKNIIYLNEIQIGDYEDNYIFINMNDMDEYIDISEIYIIFKLIENNIDNIRDLRNIFIITDSKKEEVIRVNEIINHINLKFNRYSMIKCFNKDYMYDKMNIELKSLEDMEIQFNDYKLYIYKNLEKFNLISNSYDKLLLDSQDNIQTYNIILGYLELDKESNKTLKKEIFEILYDNDFKI